MHAVGDNRRFYVHTVYRLENLMKFPWTNYLGYLRKQRVILDVMYLYILKNIFKVSFVIILESFMTKAKNTDASVPPFCPIFRQVTRRLLWSAATHLPEESLSHRVQCRKIPRVLPEEILQHLTYTERAPHTALEIPIKSSTGTLLPRWV